MGGGGAARRRKVVHGLAALFLLACGSNDESQAPPPPSPKVACRFDVRFSNCREPAGTEWTADCITVPTEARCHELTRSLTQMVDGCAFEFHYRDVDTDPGECVKTTSHAEP